MTTGTRKRFLLRVEGYVEIYADVDHAVEMGPPQTCDFGDRSVGVWKGVSVADVTDGEVDSKIKRRNHA